MIHVEEARRIWEIEWVFWLLSNGVPLTKIFSSGSDVHILRMDFCRLHTAVREKVSQREGRVILVRSS